MVTLNIPIAIALLLFFTTALYGIYLSTKYDISIFNLLEKNDPHHEKTKRLFVMFLVTVGIIWMTLYISPD